MAEAIDGEIIEQNISQDSAAFDKIMGDLQDIVMSKYKYLCIYKACKYRHRTTCFVFSVYYCEE